MDGGGRHKNTWEEFSVKEQPAENALQSRVCRFEWDFSHHQLFAVATCASWTTNEPLEQNAKQTPSTTPEKANDCVLRGRKKEWKGRRQEEGKKNYF